MMSFDHRVNLIRHRLELESQVEKSYGINDTAQHLIEMNNKLSCVDPREKQKEMLRGQYKLIRSYRTEPAQLI